MSDTDRAARGPVFFLSYARPSAAARLAAAAERDYVAFYHDLCAALVSDVSRDRLYFLGVTSAGRHGGTAAETAQAIAECDVFIPLLSPQYFVSEQCERELAAFEDRIKTSPIARPDSIVRVLWAPVSQPWMAPTPYRTGASKSDERYLNDGLLQLQAGYVREYRSVVGRLAQRIIEVSERRSPYQETASIGLAAPVPLPPPLALHDLTVFLLAPTADFPVAASAAGQYGPGILDWSPFDDNEHRLAGSLVTIAHDCGWSATVAAFDPDDPRLFGDVRPQAPAVLVVDPRALDDPVHRSALLRFDALDKPWIGIAVAWNPADTDETERKRLLDQLGEILEYRFARRSWRLRMDTPVATSLQTFGLVLDATANHARIQLANLPLARTGHCTEDERS